MALSATRVSKAKPSDKLTDGGGLYLLVNPKGGRCCRLDYHYMGKRKTLASKCFAGSRTAEHWRRRTALCRTVAKYFVMPLPPGGLSGTRRAIRQSS